jgi:hypothetical protein
MECACHEEAQRPCPGRSLRFCGDSNSTHSIHFCTHFIDREREPLQNSRDSVSIQTVPSVSYSIRVTQVRNGRSEENFARGRLTLADGCGEGVSTPKAHTISPIARA